MFYARRRTADDFATVPAANFELLAVRGASAVDWPPAAASIVGRAVPTTYPLLAVPVSANIAAASAACASHHAGHATTDGATAARGHVQSHSFRLRGKCRFPHL